MYEFLEVMPVPEFLDGMNRTFNAGFKASTKLVDATGLLGCKAGHRIGNVIAQFRRDAGIGSEEFFHHAVGMITNSGRS